MSSGSYWQVYVRCPFYKSDDAKQKLVCEGITEESNLSQHFRSKHGLETQLQVFCCEHYTKCEIYRMLIEKYEE